MDFKTTYRLEANFSYDNRQANHRRSSTEGNQFTDCPSIPADFDDNEDLGNDIRRRERLAQACYEC